MSRDAIVNLLNVYAAALDAHLWDLFDEVFAADAEIDYPGTLHWRDLASFKRDFGAYHEALETHEHVMSNHQVIVRDDRANSLTYGTYRLVERVKGEDGAQVREGRCWYDDQLVLGRSGWRIRTRLARVFWASGTAPARAVVAGEGITSNAVDSLVAEARAGRVAYFNALRATA